LKHFEEIEVPSLSQSSGSGGAGSHGSRLALSVVVPCFNEQENIHALHERLSKACRDAAGESYEIALVNDGSSDRTFELICGLADKDPNVVGVNLSRNHGHQLALSAGLSVCRGARILIIDADLQDPPELLPKMMTAMDHGADVVYGKRTSRLGETAFKRATATLFYRLLTRLTDTTLPVDTGDFRLMSRRALDVLLSMPEQHRFIRGMVSWIGFLQVPVEYERSERYAGETKYTLGKMIRFALDAITGFSTVPLKLATWLGVAMGGLGLCFLIWTIVEWSSGDTIRGWTSMMSIVLILGSVQLLVLGIIGEYLGRLYMQAKGRPLFVISEVVRGVRSTPASDIARLTNHAASTDSGGQN